MIGVRRPRIVVFDMDGVLVDIRSSWQYLHEKFGVEDEALRIMKRFIEGEIDYLEWMRLDTSLWIKASGGRLHRSTLVKMFDEVEVNPEAVEVVRRLRRLGVRIGILSGGIDLLAMRVARIIGADAWMANGLVFDKRGYLVPGGRPIVGVDKSRPLRRMLWELGLEPSEAVYVGDSEWDISAFKTVAYPVLYGEDEKARPYVRYVIKRLEELVDIVGELSSRAP